MSVLLRDPWFEAKVDRAVARYGRRWTAEQVEAFRQAMATTLETHPRTRHLIAIARPDLHLREWPCDPT